MEDHTRDAAGGIGAKKERFAFWWPKTDSIERARKAAKGGSVAFGLIAFGLGQLAWFAVPVLAEGRGTTTTYDAAGSIAVFALFVYLAWRTYKRPTVLLNGIAFALIGLYLVSVILLTLTVNKVPGSAFLWAILGTVAAVGGMRGSIAVRRFAKHPPHQSEDHTHDAVGGISEKKERFAFWWPKTDSIERARKAAKGGSVVFGLLALNQLEMLVVIRRSIATEDVYGNVFLIALYSYLAWRTYKRPTILLTSIAFALIGGVLGFMIVGILTVDKVAPGAWLPLVGTVAAISGMRGSIAVRRFAKQPPRTPE